MGRRPRRGRTRTARPPPGRGRGGGERRTGGKEGESVPGSRGHPVPPRGHPGIRGGRGRANPETDPDSPILRRRTLVHGGRASPRNVPRGDGRVSLSRGGERRFRRGRGVPRVGASTRRRGAPRLARRRSNPPGRRARLPGRHRGGRARAGVRGRGGTPRRGTIRANGGLRTRARATMAMARARRRREDGTRITPVATDRSNAVPDDAAEGRPDTPGRIGRGGARPGTCRRTRAARPWRTRS